MLMAFSVIMMLPPIAVALLYSDNGEIAFFTAFMAAFFGGFVLWLPFRKRRQDFRLREGFLVVVLFWTALGFVASLPLYLSGELRLPFTDAVFEAVSGLTTTGATVIVGIDELPPSILWYRQQLQWFGGLGVVVIALAILPMLGVGGMQLYRAEVSGPTKEDKLTPRLHETVRVFFYVYLAITVACSFSYWLAGMSAFDAIGHAFATVSTGGFSTHDASIAYFQSAMIEIICIFFMMVGGISFALHFIFIRTGNLSRYWRNTECRTFILMVIGVTFIGTFYLLFAGHHEVTFKAFMAAAFQVVSVMTSTGFGTETFAEWPGFMPVLLMFISIMGACAGSTSGGMKTIRVLMVFRQGVREIHRLVHPNAEIPMKLNGRVVTDHVMEAIWGFFAVYALVYVLLMILMLAAGLDQVSAFGAVAATLNNLGPGLGEVASNFTTVSDFAKWLGVVGMLMGRLEIFTVLVLLTPDFWRK